MKRTFAVLAFLFALLVSLTAVASAAETGPGSTACFEANQALVQANGAEKAYHDSEVVKLPNLKVQLAAQNAEVVKLQGLIATAVESAKPALQTMLDTALKSVATLQAQITVIDQRAAELAANTKAAQELRDKACYPTPGQAPVTNTTTPLTPLPPQVETSQIVVPNTMNGVNTGA